MARVEWAKKSESLDTALERYEDKVRGDLMTLIEKEIEIDTYQLSYAIRQYGRRIVRHHKDNPSEWNTDPETFSG